MSEVKRYRIRYNDQYGKYEVSPGGICGYEQPEVVVKYEDYAALQQKLDAVLAENVALKDINAWCKTEAFENMYREFKTAEAIGCPDVDCMHDAMLTALMHAPLTPATDTILNEVRAEGVDMYAQSLRRKQEDAFTESEHRHTRLGRAAVSAEKFAAQLRSGSTEGGA